MVVTFKNVKNLSILNLPILNSLKKFDALPSALYDPVDMDPKQLTTLRKLTAWVFVIAIIFFTQDPPSGISLIIGGLLGFIGACLRYWASGYLMKNNQLTIQGPYALTRNPLYFGTYLMGIATALLAHLPWAALIISLAFGIIYHYVILAEETKLAGLFGEPYQDYLKTVPRFFPNLLKFKRTHSFSPSLANKNKAYEAFLTLIAILIGLYCIPTIKNKLGLTRLAFTHSTSSPEQNSLLTNYAQVLKTIQKETPFRWQTRVPETATHQIIEFAKNERQQWVFQSLLLNDQNLLQQSEWTDRTAKAERIDHITSLIQEMTPRQLAPEGSAEIYTLDPPLQSFSWYSTETPAKPHELKIGKLPASLAQTTDSPLQNLIPIQIDQSPILLANRSLVSLLNQTPLEALREKRLLWFSPDDVDEVKIISTSSPKTKPTIKPEITVVQRNSSGFGKDMDALLKKLFATQILEYHNETTHPLSAKPILQLELQGRNLKTTQVKIYSDTNSSTSSLATVDQRPQAVFKVSQVF
jgi:protein-S-isoprenylcysteine O-methyltransferase Ste14